MKAILKAFGAVALAGAMTLPALAQSSAPAATTTNSAPAATTTNTDAKDLKKVVEDQGINYVQTAQKGITLSGYVDVSYTEQFSKGFAQPTAPGEPNSANLRQFDLNNDNFNVNAVKVALEQALTSTNTWQAGFRLDTIYGQDASVLNNTAGVVGHESAYGASTSDDQFYLEQALVKFNIPIGNGLQIYAGKFVTLLGYEVIESPANPNFSRGLLFTNAIPLTNTGVYADYKFNSTVEAKLGVVDGWNNSLSVADGSDEAFGGKALTGQLVVNAPGGNANITQSFIWSPNSEPAIAAPTSFSGTAAPTTASLEVYDIWGNWTPTFDKNGNTTLGFNIDYGNDSYSWYGAALYAQYKFSKVFSLNGRGEYLHSDANAGKFGVGGITGPGGSFVPLSQDDYSFTLTAAFNIWDNLLTRVEYRLDDLSKGTTGTSSEVDNEISLEAVYSF